MKYIKLFEDLNEANIPQDKIEFKGEIMKPKKEVLAEIKSIMKGDMPKIEKVEVYEDDRGVYSGDGKNTAIKFITVKGNELIYKYIHAKYSGNDDPSGEKRPCLIKIKNAKGELVRYDYWGKEKDLKEIERKGIQIPTKEDVQKTLDIFYPWLKQKFGIDVEAYQTSENSNTKDYLQNNMYIGDLKFGASERAGKSVGISIDLANGIATLSYYRLVGGTSDSGKRNEVKLKINSKKNIFDIMNMLMKNPAWKTIGTEIDQAFGRYAKSFSDFYKDRGHTSGTID